MSNSFTVFLQSRWITQVRHLLEKDVRDLFRSCRQVDDELLRELRAVMIRATGDAEAADRIVEEVARTERGRLISHDRLVKAAERATRTVIGPEK